MGLMVRRSTKFLSSFDFAPAIGEEAQKDVRPKRLMSSRFMKIPGIEAVAKPSRRHELAPAQQFVTHWIC
jgi:hypothetical protein